MTDQIIQDIIDSIDKAIGDFQGKIPGIQNRVFDELQNSIQQLASKDGKILSSVDNLKLIAKIKNRVGRIVVDKDYVSAVKEFLAAYNTVATLQNSYFAAFNDKYKPSKVLDVIKSISVDATLNSLLDSGISANVIDKMGDVLRNNITGGGSMSKLSNQLRDHILTNEIGLGSLDRYVTQITTDSLNQYSAQYQQAIAADLGFNWGRYVGSNLKTTREFCEYLTKKEWVHRSELPAIVKGDIDGHQCKVGNNGLPLGMIPGTNDNNFQIFRGGYNCGHQFFWVPDSAVPKNILNKFINASNPKVVAPGERMPIGKPVSGQFSQIDKKIGKQVTNTLSAIDKVHGDGVLDDIPFIRSSSKQFLGAFYSRLGTPLKIELSTAAKDAETTLAHEMGHYLDLHAIGKPGSFESDNPNGLLKDVINAISQTPTIRNISDSLKRGFLTIDGADTKLSNVYKDHLRYMLRPKEMFARAYAQFVAKRSGDVQMSDQIKKRVEDDKRLGIGYQFTEEEFTQIESEIERVFIAQKWISP